MRKSVFVISKDLVLIQKKEKRNHNYLKKKKLRQKKKDCSEIDNFMIFILFDFDKLRLW